VLEERLRALRAAVDELEREVRAKAELWFTSSRAVPPDRAHRGPPRAARERIVRAAHALIAAAATARRRSPRSRAAPAWRPARVPPLPSKAELFAEVFRRASQREVDATRAAAEAAAAGAAAHRAPRRDLRAPRAARAGAWPGRCSPSPSTRPSRSSAWPSAARTPPASRAPARRRRGRRAAPQNVELTAAALVGALGEALVGPLSPVAADVDADALVADLVTFCLRSVTEETADAHHADRDPRGPQPGPAAGGPQPLRGPRALAEALEREGGGWARERLRAAGAFWGGEPMRWGVEANEHPPVLHTTTASATAATRSSSTRRGTRSCAPASRRAARAAVAHRRAGRARRARGAYVCAARPRRASAARSR
jgi:hypothetical protein